MSPTAGLYGIFGHPIAHSLSPDIHNAWFRQHGIDARYERFDVPPDRLREELLAAKDRGVLGLNITVPHKQAALETPGLIDLLDTTVRRIGAVNTVVRRGDEFVGYNTDAAGFVLPLKELGVAFEGTHALIVGAGGAARAIAFGLADAGATQLTILNRTGGHARALAESGAMATGQRVTCVATEWNGGPIDPAAIGAALVVHTTTLGMSGKSDSPRLKGDLHGIAVVDIVYRPLETALLIQAKSLGATVYDGLLMLAGQAALSFELWTGIRPQWRSAYESLKQVLSE